ncbi:hypothetical protein DIPPA_05239 [Diplonema papillatum]|nr:hypothetical protein DIPPA_05239 [Diplonema papillatum]
MSASLECCICFDPLPGSVVAVLMDKKRRARVCNHYFHFECIKLMHPYVTRGYGLDMEVERSSTGDMQCPLCRQQFHGICRMPDPGQDTKRWLKLVDVDRSGYLTKAEVKEVVRSICEVSDDDVAELLGSRWKEWDPSDSGRVKLSRTLGLLEYVHEKLGSTMRETIGCPHITEDKLGWFVYWDQSGSGDLTKKEVVRALVKTFENVCRDKRDMDVQAMVDSAWPLFDTNGSNSVTKAEFLARDGLADTIIAILESDTGYSVQAIAKESHTPQEAVSVYRASSSSRNLSERGRSRDPHPNSPPINNDNDKKEGINAWACPQCTFLNWRYLNNCSLCEIGNPHMSPSTTSHGLWA